MAANEMALPWVDLVLDLEVSHVLCCLVSVHDGHVQVHEHEVEHLSFLEVLLKLFAGFRAADACLVVDLAVVEQAFEDSQLELAVVDDQDLLFANLFSICRIHRAWRGVVWVVHVWRLRYRTQGALDALSSSAGLIALVGGGVFLDVQLLQDLGEVLEALVLVHAVELIVELTVDLNRVQHCIVDPADGVGLALLNLL